MDNNELDALVNEFNSLDDQQLALLRRIFDAMAARGPHASFMVGGSQIGSNQLNQLPKLEPRFLENFINNHNQKITIVNYGQD